MTPENLSQWLEYIERIHPKSIEMGLDRIARVRDALGPAPAVPAIVVGGTNGKGSACAYLDAILRAAGYAVGLYTSPHLLRYNERVRVNGEEASDEQLIAAFERVERARGDTQLTYFEFGTLAAWDIFASARLDCLVLEVGMGGRLDAVNVLDADCAVLTSIGLDHMDYLGGTREAIGREKAGIFRRGRPAILADPDPPASVLEHALTIGANLHVLGRDFGYRDDGGQWDYWGRRARYSGLAPPAMRGRGQLANASGAIAALDALHQRLPVAMRDVRSGLAGVNLPGRFQVLPGKPVVVLDVAHNPDAAGMLAGNLGDMGSFEETYAVIGMLQDKDMAGVAGALKDRVTHWCCASLPGERGADASVLARAVRQSGAGGDVSLDDSPSSAFAQAKSRAGENDRIVVFGSFLTVAEIIALRSAPRR